MKPFFFTALVIGTATAVCSAAEFEKPVRLMVGNQAIRVEGPGYAAPCWGDLYGDGMKQLLVGQFNDGKIQVFKRLSGNQFAPGHWLQADRAVAKVPGVW